MATTTSKKSIKDLQSNVRAKREAVADIESKLNNFDEILLKRELKEEEQKAQREQSIKLNVAQRELNSAMRELQEAIENEKAAAVTREPAKSSAQRFREMLKGVREGKLSREVTLGGDGGVQASGAVNLTIQDIIPTLTEGTALPAGATLVTGVTGNEVWPVSADDVEMTEQGETDALKDQTLSFDKINVSPKRVGLLVYISNAAIDDASFDLLGFAQKKFNNAGKKYFAEKLYSQAAWEGNKGPFSGKTPDGTITLGPTAYKDILKAVAKLTDAGYDSSKVCLVMDATTEADLKATAKAEGQGGFVIENGKCAGYDYVVSHFINTKLNSDKTALEATPDRYLGVGLFQYEAIQQHGDVRLNIDSTSAAVTQKDVTAIVLNTRVSFTDLSAKTTTNGKKNTKSTAFGLYKIAEPAAAAAAATGN